MDYKYMEKLFNAYSKFKRKCENCGNVLIITKQNPIKICRWCGHKVYYDEKTKFKDLLKSKL